MSGADRQQVAVCVKAIDDSNEVTRIVRKLPSVRQILSAWRWYSSDENLTQASSR